MSTTPVGPGGTPESKRPDENSENMKHVADKMEKVWEEVTSTPKTSPGKKEVSRGFDHPTTSKITEKIRSKL